MICALEEQGDCSDQTEKKSLDLSKKTSQTYFFFVCFVFSLFFFPLFVCVCFLFVLLLYWDLSK